jgi:hypothetical protein
MTGLPKGSQAPGFVLPLAALLLSDVSPMLWPLLTHYPLSLLVYFDLRSGEEMIASVPSCAQPMSYPL